MAQANLSKTETTVFSLIALNNTTFQIAEKLQISNRTVDRHRSNICKKLNISGHNALLRYVIEHKDEVLTK